MSTRREMERASARPRMIVQVLAPADLHLQGARAQQGFLSFALHSHYAGAMSALILRYLGGCPGRDRPDTVVVDVGEDRFEMRGKGWGWRIAFSAVRDVGDPQPAPDGEGQMLPVVWEPPDGAERTLMLSGQDAGRLRFLLAQAVATRRFEEARASELPPPSQPPQSRPSAGPWARELRRMRAITVAAMTMALVTLVIVFGVAIVVVGARQNSGHWPADRATLARLQNEIQTATDRGDTATLARALQGLEDECRRLEAAYNNDGGNRGTDFTEAKRICATIDVALY